MGAKSPLHTDAVAKGLGSCRRRNAVPLCWSFDSFAAVPSDEPVSRETAVAGEVCRRCWYAESVQWGYYGYLWHLCVDLYRQRILEDQERVTSTTTPVWDEPSIVRSWIGEPWFQGSYQLSVSL